MKIGKRYAWSWRDDGRCWLYAADHRALTDISRHPRRLGRIGLKLAREIAKKARSLRHRARLEARFQCGGARPLLLLLGPGRVDEIYIAADSWRDLRGTLTRGAR